MGKKWNGHFEYTVLRHEPNWSKSHCNFVWQRLHCYHVCSLQAHARSEVSTKSYLGRVRVNTSSGNQHGVDLRRTIRSGSDLTVFVLKSWNDRESPKKIFEKDLSSSSVWEKRIVTQRLLSREVTLIGREIYFHSTFGQIYDLAFRFPSFLVRCYALRLNSKSLSHPRLSFLSTKLLYV